MQTMTRCSPPQTFALPDTPADLVVECQRRQIALWVDGGRLRHRAPTGAMNVDLLRRLKAQEGQLVSHLSELRLPGYLGDR